MLQTLDGYEQTLTSRLLSTAASLLDAIPPEERVGGHSQFSMSMRVAQAGCRSTLTGANAYTARVSLASLTSLMQSDEHACVIVEYFIKL